MSYRHRGLVPRGPETLWEIIPVEVCTSDKPNLAVKRFPLTAPCATPLLPEGLADATSATANREAQPMGGHFEKMTRYAPQAQSVPRRAGRVMPI
jgi:hypothetical protein